MDLKAVCEAMEKSLVQRHGHNPSKFKKKIAQSAEEAAKNLALGPLILFMEWVQCNDSAQAALKEQEISWNSAPTKA